jgi:hypothetical protein
MLNIIFIDKDDFYTCLQIIYLYNCKKKCVLVMVNWSKIKLIGNFTSHLIGYLFFIGLLNFVLSVWPYYAQWIVHGIVETPFIIDNFNLYVIGYTLFLIVITHFAPIVNKSKHILWRVFGAFLLILFIISTACLALEYHDFITNQQNYSIHLREFSRGFAKIFISFNVLFTFLVVLMQSVSYSYLKVKES